MKNARILLMSSSAFLVFASCDKSRPPAAGTAPGEDPAGLEAERALIEEERMVLERLRLEEERMALEEEKEALRAEREARLAAREDDVEATGLSLEERQRQLAEREFDLGLREDELESREASLSEQELELAGRDVLDDWEPEPLPEMQQPVADFDTFYEDLQPYGSWYETPDYGYVYQPAIVVQDSSWRPYTRGRWACTNLGWSWVSEEPFGWACFHYGRWALLQGRGWVWVPGDEWAPSWVCWREGGEHVGWAPLPPETLCFRGRGWDSSVEAEFGIGALCFNFVHRRHMADPLWRHCLPVDQNPRCIGQTNNITNIRFHHDRIIAGGPAYERLRRDVGKAWPVYQIKTDRFEAIRDLNRRNASVRGRQLAVFAPNLNTRWNDRLKPSSVAGRWDDVKVVRAESGIKPQWTERFREMREKRKEDSSKTGDLAGKQKLLEENKSKVGEAQRKFQEKQQQMTEARREKQLLRREVAQEAARRSPVKDRPPVEGKPAVAEREPAEAKDREPSLAERQRQAAARLRETRARQAGNPEGATTPAADKESGAARIERMREELRERELARIAKQNEAAEQQRQARIAKQTEAAETPRDKPEATREGTPAGSRMNDRPAGRVTDPVVRGPREESPVAGNTDAANERRARTEEARRLQQEEAAQREQARNEKEQENVRQREQARNEQEGGKLRQAMEERRQQQEQMRQQQEQARGEAEENNRRGRMEEARQQQQEAARAQAEQARQEQAERQRELEVARARQMEEARARQEQSRREAEENNRRQQQEEMRRQQQEQARQQMEERARQQQEERARQQEQMRQQQEEARRQAEERSRQQQEERARQQEQARQQQEERARQQEQARQQQEQEQQRRQEERAREQQERQRGR